MVVTLLPLSPSRAVVDPDWDFPRLHIAGGFVLLAVLAPLVAAPVGVLAALALAGVV